MAKPTEIDLQDLTVGEQLNQQLATLQEQVNGITGNLEAARLEVAAIKEKIAALEVGAPPTGEAIQAAVQAAIDEEMRRMILEKRTLTDEQKLKLDEILRSAGEDAVS